MAEETPALMTFETDDLSLVWSEGCVLVTTSEMTLLMDAPPSAISLVERIPVSAPIRGILCSSGRMSSVGGLLGVLDCISGHDSDGVLPIYAPMGDDRPGLLVESWTRGWPNGVSVCLGLYFRVGRLR